MSRHSDRQKKNRPNSRLGHSGRVNVKGSKKRDKYLDPARELKKTMEHESDDDINCNRCAVYSYQMIGKGTKGFENMSSSGDSLNYSIVEIGQNTERSPGDLH